MLEECEAFFSATYLRVQNSFLTIDLDKKNNKSLLRQENLLL
jgi:hypothetical protein